MLLTPRTKDIEPLLHFFYICSSNTHSSNSLCLQSSKELWIVLHKSLKLAPRRWFLCGDLVCLQASNSSINHSFCCAITTQIRVLYIFVYSINLHIRKYLVLASVLDCDITT